MKYYFVIFQLLLFHSAFSQVKELSHVDKKASLIGYYLIDELHDKLEIKSYSDSEKVRSFYYWITQHISYDVAEFHWTGYVAPKRVHSTDSLENIKLHLNDYGAYVLKRKKGVCEGYATIFKLLCDRSNIECVIIHGCGKTDVCSIGQSLTENHAWNAVKINGKWQLIDACWASGFCDNMVTKFTKQLNENYYLAPPDRLIYDHYPTDTQWTLLAKPPSKKEFENFPVLFSRKNKVKFDSTSLMGNIIAHLGDTLTIKVEVLSENLTQGNYISCIDAFDEKGEMIPRSITSTNQTFNKDGNKLTYTYRVGAKNSSLLYLAYGSEYVAAYRLQVK